MYTSGLETRHNYKERQVQVMLIEVFKTAIELRSSPNRSSEKSLGEYAKVQLGWQDTSASIVSEIECAYQCHNPKFKLDPNDQVHFAVALYHAVRFFQPARIIQTGTFTGVSLIAILKAARKYQLPIHITTIDPEPKQYNNVDNPVDIAREIVHREGLDPFVIFLKGYSGDKAGSDGLPYDLLKTLPSTFDMLVVDGDHSFQGAYGDLRHGCSLLRGDGGLVFVHDYNGIAQVKAAVDLWLNRTENIVDAIRTGSPSGLAMFQLSTR